MKLRVRFATGKTSRSDPERDRGAVMIWFALATVALVGMGSLVVDVGALLSERRELQNGADAAVLAVATECAFRTCTPTAAMSTATQYANLNADDRVSAVSLLCGRASGLTLCPTPPSGVGTANYAHVKTQTIQNSGDDPSEIPFLLAPILDPSADGKTVAATATVVWGALAADYVLPLAAPRCFIDSTWLVNGKWVFPATAVRFEVPSSSWSGTRCLIDGVSVPAAFDFLNVTACDSVNLNLTSGTQLLAPNNGTNPNCKDLLRAKVYATTPEERTIIVPIYGTRLGGGTGAYVVDGVVAMELCGYQLGGAGYVENQCSNPSTCTGRSPERFLCGIFKNLDLTQGTIGGGSDYGTRVIKMVG